MGGAGAGFEAVMLLSVVGGLALLSLLASLRKEQGEGDDGDDERPPP
jgi:hypothetical protein